jgi:hypothetical protein
MQISKIISPAFCAKTTITAPKSLLSDEDAAYLKDLGSKIGTDKDSISITLSELQSGSMAPNIQSYRLTRKARFEVGKTLHIIDNSKMVPYLNNGKELPHAVPKKYLIGVIKQIAQQYKLYK